ncbi:hypothetical protein GGF32_001055 [Allomyces javanicus]|nr:hypothetical protein GGF32_001055 [Allomyces javanicus]
MAAHDVPKIGGRIFGKGGRVLKDLCAEFPSLYVLIHVEGDVDHRPDRPEPVDDSAELIDYGALTPRLQITLLVKGKNWTPRWLAKAQEQAREVAPNASYQLHYVGLPPMDEYVDYPDLIATAHRILAVLNRHAEIIVAKSGHLVWCRRETLLRSRDGTVVTTAQVNSLVVGKDSSEPHESVPESVLVVDTKRLGYHDLVVAAVQAERDPTCPADERTARIANVKTALRQFEDVHVAMAWFLSLQQAVEHE